jgi:membrane fusion protein (multidrug efflux system)
MLWGCVAMTTSAIDDVLSSSHAHFAPPRPSANAKPSLALRVLPVLTAAALGAGTLGFVAGHGKETTDDAQVEAHVASVSPRVGGQVTRVLVRDNQRVHAGDVLVELDDRDFVVKTSAARADLAAAEATLHAAETKLGVTSKNADSNLAIARGGLAQASAVGGTTRAAIEQARAELTAAEARRTLSRANFARAKSLFASGAVPRAELDARKAASDQADAEVVQAKARVASARASVENSSGTLEVARGHLLAAEAGPEQVEAARAEVALASARVDQAKAALAQAELNLGYTKIKAEVSGVVSRRTVEVGQLASPERPLLAVVGLDDTWVVANFKEDQIGDMRPGQPVTVKVDSLDGDKLAGRLDSLAGGTGSRFSLLPPDNASGNFTKVVQRVPVLVRLDPHPGVELRPGLSATVTVSTRD